MFFSRPAGIKVVDRGDPVAVDWAKETLTTNAAWHDLDLSSIVPVGTKMVELVIKLNDNALGSAIQFRKKGKTGMIILQTGRVQTLNVNMEKTIVVECDSDRLAEYMADNVSWITLNITVCRYWL